MTRKRTKTAITPERLHFFARRYVFFILTCLSILAIFSTPLLGGDAPKLQRHAVIFGTVWGPDDRPLSGVEVKVRRASEKKARWYVYSSRRGEFEVAFRPERPITSFGQLPSIPNPLMASTYRAARRLPCTSTMMSAPTPDCI